MNTPTPVSRNSAPHYKWAEVCDGWRLVDQPELSVIEERVPAGASEVRHYHEKARQFFYILTGEAILEIAGKEHHLPAGSGIEVPPREPHQFINRSGQDVRFLVTSVPPTANDRVNLA